MATTVLPSVTAQDGHVVTYDPQGLWKIIGYDDVYTGANGFRKVVPPVGSWIFNKRTKQYFECTAVDLNTLIATLVPVDGDDGELITDPQTARPNTMRANYDNSTLPYTLSVDSRLFWGGSEAAYARIFRGTDTSHNGQVIAFMQDNTGAVMTNNIPLEDVARENVTGILQKTVKTARTTASLATGELITVVLYSDEGKVQSSETMRVVNTSWIPATAADSRNVTHVSIYSPFLSAVNDRLVEYPINVQLSALNLFGVVHYSDGSQSEPQPIDGEKFAVFGLDQFVGVYPTQRAGLTLRYRLDINEASSAATSADGKFISAAYELVTTEQQGAYTIRLAGYPVWNPVDNAYRMRWFMTDLNRDLVLDVTPYVNYNAASDLWDGTKIGQIQALSVRVNLNDISKSYPSYVHTQMEWVTLTKLGTEAGPNWKIAFNQNQQPQFGESLSASAVMINQNLWRVSMRFGANTKQEWLNRIYYDAKPLYDLRSEERAPEPTHMVIFAGVVRTEVSIDNWDKEFQVAVNFSNQTNIQIEFIARTQTGDLKLAVVAMPIKRI